MDAKLKEYISQFVADRDAAFSKAVTDDDWDGLKAFLGKYKMDKPDNEDIMKAGVYKAVQECTDIPQEVKEVAKTKCIALGFRPTM